MLQTSSFAHGQVVVKCRNYAIAVAIAGLVVGAGCDSPVVIAPADLTVECDGLGNQAELAAWLDSATFVEGCGGTELTNDFAALVADCGAAGAVTVTWTATDDCDNTATASATFTIADTLAPELEVPEPIAVTCGEAGAAEALTDWLDAATSSDLCGDSTITHSRSPAPGACTATITWTAADECGNMTSLSSTYTTNGDTTDPTMTLVGDDEITIECGAEFQDPGVDISDDCDVLIQPVLTGEVDVHTPGMYEVTYESIDACGNTGPTLSRTVTVVDTTPPEITMLATPQLWPPNHELHTLTLADLITVTDSCEGDLDPNKFGTILDIYSDEPENANGDGNTTGDIVIVDNHTFHVRAERQGGSNGRVYGIHFEVTDSSGNTAEGTAFLHVPHDQSGAEAVDDGPDAGYTVFP